MNPLGQQVFLSLLLSSVWALPADPQQAKVTVLYGQNGAANRQETVAAASGEAPVQAPAQADYYRLYPRQEVPPPPQDAWFGPKMQSFLPDWSVLKQPYNYQIYGGHTPLGELWANKMDLLPAIFKTGVVVAVALVILKVIFGLLLFKQTLFIKKLAALAKLGAGVGALAVKAPLAVKATLGDEKAAEEPSRKRRSGSPVVDSETDLEEMASQLDSILEGFDPKED